MVKTKLEEYRGTKTPTFLEGDFGRDFLEEYQGRARADYGNAKVLDVLRENNDLIKGSNDYAVVLANKILRQVGLRTATPEDVEKILRENRLDLKDFYVDIALVLRSEDEPNSYLAKDLRKQIGRGKRLPVMISLIGLDLRIDENSPRGLSFDLREDVKVIQDDTLISDGGYFNSEDIDIKIGLPKKLGNGNRYFYTQKLGLSRLCLLRGSSLDAYFSDSGYLNVDGIITAVRDD